VLREILADAGWTARPGRLRPGNGRGSAHGAAGPARRPGLSCG